MNQPSPTPYLLTGHGLLYILQRVVPLILFGLVSWIALMIQRGGGNTTPLTDRVLFDLAVADCLREHFMFGLTKDLSIPCTSHTLWQILVAAVGWIVPNLLNAGLLINAAMAIVVVWQSIRLSEKFLEHPMFVLGCGSVVAVSLPVVGGILNQGPELLGIALILTAFRLHISGLIGNKPVLPVRAALCVGLAMLVHIEYAAIWLGLCLHAMILAGGQHHRFSSMNVILRSLIGVTILTLLVWPAVHKNMTATGMPWPAASEHIPALDISAGPSSGILELEAPPPGIAESFIGLGTGLLELNGLPAAAFYLLILFGLLFIALHYSARDRNRAFLLGGVLLLLFPLALGLLGTGNQPVKLQGLLGSIFPLLAIAGTYALYHIGSGKSRKLGIVLVMCGCFVWVACSVAGTIIKAKENQARLRHEITLRQNLNAWQQKFITNNGRIQVITDAPGWLAYSKSADVGRELMGWVTPTFAKNCKTTDGHVDHDKLLDEIHKMQPRPQAMILWSQSGVDLGARLKSTWGKNIIDGKTKDNRPTILVIPPAPKNP